MKIKKIVFCIFFVFHIAFVDSFLNLIFQGVDLFSILYLYLFFRISLRDVAIRVKSENSFLKWCWGLGLGFLLGLPWGAGGYHSVLRPEAAQNQRRREEIRDKDGI